MLDHVNKVLQFYQLQGAILCLLFHNMTMRCTIIIIGTWKSVHKITVYKYICVKMLDWKTSIDISSSQTLCILYQKSSVSCILQKSVMSSLLGKYKIFTVIFQHTNEHVYLYKPHTNERVFKYASSTTNGCVYLHLLLIKKTILFTWVEI